VRDDRVRVKVVAVLRMTKALAASDLMSKGFPPDEGPRRAGGSAPGLGETGGGAVFRLRRL